MGETVVFIEAKEMACDAMNVKQAVNAGLSSYKKIKSEVTKPKTKSYCKHCRTEIEHFVWNKRLGKMIECTLCLAGKKRI